MKSWESSPGYKRFFANCCGSPIYKEDVSNPSILRLRLGTLDSDPEVKVELHYMVGSKAPWVDIQDGLAKEFGGLPFGEVIR